MGESRMDSRSQLAYDHRAGSPSGILDLDPDCRPVGYPIASGAM
jgi:hypothetical protein